MSGLSKLKYPCEVQSADVHAMQLRRAATLDLPFAWIIGNDSDPKENKEEIYTSMLHFGPRQCI